MSSQPTLLEFLEPVLRGSRRQICLATMSYQAARNAPAVTAAELKEALVAARVPRARQYNVPDVLGKAGRLVSADHHGRNKVWSLTSSGEQFVATALGVDTLEPEIKNSVDGLTKLLTTISDDVVRGYIEEALLCYRVDARRAAVVFLWSGAIRHLQEQAMSRGVMALNAAVGKHDQKAKQVSKIEDFSAIKDVIQLLGFRELGLVDKGQWQTLREGLDLRNRCGHPTKYIPGTAKVAAFIEDIVGIVF